MLAGDLPDGVNLIFNGDFESFTNDESSNVVNEFATARFYGSDLVPGWSVADGDGDSAQRINLLTFDNDRGTVLDVDSIPGQDDRLFQDVNVRVGQQYLFSFDYLNPDQVEGLSDPATNGFEVYYNGQLLGALDGVNVFQRASFVVTGAANDSAGSTVDGDSVAARFEFRDGSSGDRGGDGRGSLIDAVSLIAVSEQPVVNGDFENVDSAGTSFSPDETDGFSVFSFDDDTEDRLIQVLSDDDGDTSDPGNRFLNLNSSSELLDQVFQNLATEAGESYYVTFDLRVDPTSDLSPDELRVRFDNEFAATIIGTDQWQSFGVVVNASSDISRLTFREAGEDLGDGASPQIDNLRFYQIDSVAPPVNDLLVDANGAGDGLNAEAVFQVNGGPQSIASDVVLSHDSGTTLNFALIALVGDSISTAESLAVDTSSTNIVAEFNSQSGELILQGQATLAEYQQVIRSLVYNTTADNPVDRLVGISITDSNIVDGTNFSQRQLVDVEIGQSLTLAAIGDQTLGFGQALSLSLDASSAAGDDTGLSFEIVEDGSIAGGLSVSDAGELTLPVASQAGSFDVVVAVTDVAGQRVEQSFVIDVAEFVPFEGVGALSNIPPEQRSNIYSSPPPQNIDTSLTYDAVLDTSEGEVRIRLLDDESPTFVNNFINLAQDGFYDGLTFHRVIDGFVGQGGDPLGTGFGGPGFEIPDEVGNDIEFTSRGQLSFANAGNNTTGSQFFITFEPTFLNNNQFSVFGNVTSGDAVLDQLTRTETNNIPIPGVEPSVINSIRIEVV